MFWMNFPSQVIPIRVSCDNMVIYYLSLHLERNFRILLNLFH